MDDEADCIDKIYRFLALRPESVAYLGSIALYCRSLILTQYLPIFSGRCG